MVEVGVFAVAVVPWPLGAVPLQTVFEPFMTAKLFIVSVEVTVNVKLK